MVSHTRTEEQSLAQWVIDETDLRPCPWDDPERDLLADTVVEVTEEYNEYIMSSGGDGSCLLCAPAEIDQDLLVGDIWDDGV